MVSITRARYLYGKEASRYIGRSDEWLRRKVNAGKIAYVIDPASGRKMYDRHVLDAFIKPVTLQEYLLQTA